MEGALFRLLLPSSKTTALIPKLGSTPGAKVRIEHPTHGSDECVVFILADPNAQSPNNTTQTLDKAEGSPAQQALVRVFRRAVVDEASEAEKGNNGGGLVCCRLLAATSQVGCVLGRGGKIVEKIRHESGAHVRVFPRDQIPPCASPGDELFQITGDFQAVKKALLSVSGCLQDNPNVDGANSGATKISGGLIHGTGMPAQVDPIPHRGFVSGFNAADYHSRNYSSTPGPENVGGGHRMLMEEEVVFKLLCQVDKVGSLIGKGGSIIRILQSETGASIKIADCAPDSDERVVIISAQENPEQKYSPAQEAVIRVHHRIAEIGFEPGVAVVARLLVHPQHIGCLLGKGGFIITEMRRATGASIRIFPKEQVQKGGYHNDEVVQGVSCGTPRGTADVGLAMAPRNGSLRSGSQLPYLSSTTVEIMIPQTLICHVYGEYNSKLWLFMIQSLDLWKPKL